MYRSQIKESNEKKEKQDNKKELGKFCSYYGYDTIITPSKIKNKQSNIKGKKKTLNKVKISKEVSKI